MAYLLNPLGQHGYGDRFFKLFLENVLKVNFDYSTYEVKVEYKNIDILIHNDQDAILIENKIYAGDSNHDSDLKDGTGGLRIIEPGYRGQLERYYNTIVTGRDSKSNQIDCQRNVVQVAYLTLDGHLPTQESLGNLPKEKLELIEYTKHINNWLTLCAQDVETDNQLLSQIIHQYKELIVKLTSDVGIAKVNQSIVSDNIEAAWELERTNNFFTKNYAPIFNHVKWHNIADFFDELELRLVGEDAVVIEKPDVETFTKVAHSKGKSTRELKIIFTFKGIALQIVNDSKGFTIGNLTDKKWGHFSGVIGKVKIADIKFNDFANENTFYTISNEKRVEIIDKMVDEIKDRFADLPNEFR